MKKLFLYICLLAYLFWGAYMIAWDVFDKDTRKDIDDTKDNKSVESIQAGARDVFGDNKYTSSKTYKTDDMNNKTKYIISIKNGYVIIYENTPDNIFEYTDIDAGLIKTVNPSFYNRLCNDIVVYDIADVYNILEDVSS